MPDEQHISDEAFRDYLSRSEEKEGDLAIYEHAKHCPACKHRGEEIHREIWRESGRILDESGGKGFK